MTGSPNPYDPATALGYAWRNGHTQGAVDQHARWEDAVESLPWYDHHGKHMISVSALYKLIEADND